MAASPLMGDLCRLALDQLPLRHEGFGTPGMILFDMEPELISKPRQVIGRGIDPPLAPGHLFAACGAFCGGGVIVHIVDNGQLRRRCRVQWFHR
jgi:hypothetical protein